MRWNDFHQCDFSGADLSRCDMRSSNFRGCKFAGGTMSPVTDEGANKVLYRKKVKDTKVTG
jgi:uncharacterized protein YjbI with pentapeptide repeats